MRLPIAGFVAIEISMHFRNWGVTIRTMKCRQEVGICPESIISVDKGDRWPFSLSRQKTRSSWTSKRAWNLTDKDHGMADRPDLMEAIVVSTVANDGEPARNEEASTFKA
jgi:hypothetical protein